MNRTRLALAASFTIILLMSLSSLVHAMSSTSYEIRSDSFGTGGSDTSSSASFQLRSSISVPAGGESSSSSFNLNAGYREKVFDQFATFQVLIQDRASQVAATALVGETVTVTSASGISVDDFIVIIENEGSGQVSAIGQVTSIVVSDVTVDFLTDSGSTPIIDGSNDVVYVLDSSSVSLGILDTAVVSTGTIGWEVNVDNDEGYSVYVFEDDDLEQSGGIPIPDVTDGSVSAGSSEYGARSSDSTLSASTFDTEETAFTSTLTQVGSRSAGDFKSRDFLTMKVAIDSSQDDGSYSHTLTFIYAGDY